MVYLLMNLWLGQNHLLSHPVSKQGEPNHLALLILDQPLGGFNIQTNSAHLKSVI